MTIRGRGFYRGNGSAQQSRLAPLLQRLRGFFGVDKERVACVPIQPRQPRNSARACLP
jgi:hypothetical protein